MLATDLASLPVIVHWGSGLGELDDAALRTLALGAVPQTVSGGLTEVTPPALLPQPADGWLGTPGLSAHRGRRGFAARLATRALHRSGDGAVRIDADDADAGLALEIELAVTPHGLVRQRLRLTNTGDDDLTVDELLAALPVPADSVELLDTTGHHLRERSPQRHAFAVGSHVRESRRGRPGADATLLVAAGAPGFGFERGLVHGVHVAWSGNHRIIAERTNGGDAVLLAGELLLPGEVVLAPGESYATPEVIGSWGDGLDALAHRFHADLRARPQHPHRPRPVTLNTWEAVYFDHGLDRLTALADAAARVGVERFVLDDGWFRGRRDDTAGLGDWEVDSAVWPDGLGPLIEHVRALGMEFGLWVEPEMVNLDSDLARAHPDWLLRGRRELPPIARAQYALDLANPDVQAYLRERLDALLDAYDIAYLKWDHNRDLVEAGDGPGGAARVHDGVLALYSLLDGLKERHPRLEIESCASGGARVDLGILARTDRVWTSDCLDPLERLPNQAYTGLVVPPELMGAHVSSPVVHSTGRAVSLGFSAGVALLHHFGIERDLAAADAAELDELAAWVRLHTEVRDLIATGRVVHADLADPALDVRGVVAADGTDAVFTITQVATSAQHPPARIRLPGLLAERRYRIRVEAPGGEPTAAPAQSALAWTGADAMLTGGALGTVGLRPPLRHPGSVTVLRVTAE